MTVKEIKAPRGYLTKERAYFLIEPLFRCYLGQKLDISFFVFWRIKNTIISSWNFLTFNKIKSFLTDYSSVLFLQVNELENIMVPWKSMMPVFVGLDNKKTILKCAFVFYALCSLTPSLVWLNANRDLSKACRSYLNLYGHISKLRGLNLFYIFVYVQLLILTFCPQFIFQIITIECIVLSKRQHYVTFQPFWHHQISLVIDVYFLIYFLIYFFVYLENGQEI